MARYAPRTRRPRACWDDFADWSSRDARKASIDVHEPKQDGPEETGLYDRHGNELMRLPEKRRPIGFLHAYEGDE